MSYRRTTLPPDVVGILDAWLLAVYQSRDKDLEMQLAVRRHQLVARGLGQSGTMVSAIASLAAQELPIRSAITYQRLLKAADVSGIAVDDSFRPYGRSELDRRIRLILVPDLRSRAVRALGLKSGGRALDGALSDIDIAGERAVRKYWAELDFVIVKNKTHHEQPAATGNTIFNVSAPVAVIQVGSGNSATAVQQIDNSTVAALSEALARLLPEIEALPDSVLPTPKKEITDVVATSRTELQNVQPNWTLLRSLLSGIAGTIQTVAALQPAYETLKGLMTLVGVNPP